ncbi:single-stranded DNA-binding protein [Vibrio breoganii]
MSICIEVFEDNETLDIREGVSDNGRKWKQVTQTVFAHLGGRFPVETKISLSDGQLPYKAGKYFFSPESFEVGQYDRLGFARTHVLVPAK